MMGIVPLYRSLVKLIHAAKHRSYHLQDIRFILSYPLVQPAGGVGPFSAEHGEIHGRRRVDPALIVRVCLDDLRHALLASRSTCGNIQLPSSALSPVAQHFIHMRELVWLKTRLENVLSKATEAMLDEARMVASELTERDILDDSVFLHHNPQANECGTLERKPHVPAQQEVKGSGNAVASAGELGVRREMFILRHVSFFPLAKEYLSSFTLNRQALATASSMSNQELVKFLTHEVPRHVTSKNIDLTLSVAVRPFDPATSRKFVEEGGVFAQAHRYFMLHFTLKPHDPVTCIEVVNSYFLQLDVASSELVEDVGYIHASHVWRQGQLEHVGRIKSDTDGGNNNEGLVLDNTVVQFELSFLNPSDNPMVMKGQLYYMLRTENDDRHLSEIPVRVISFGHLLLSNAE